MAGDSDADSSPEGGFPSWAIGVILMFFGAIMNNLGNNLMSLGHSQQKNIDLIRIKRQRSLEQRDRDPDESDLTDFETVTEKTGTWWLAGTVIFVIGALIVFLSFGFAAQSLLAALESVQFVSNVIFAKYVHGEVITNRLIWSTVAIVVGNILVVLFAEHTSVLLDNTGILELYLHNTAFHAYMVVSGVLYFACYAVFCIYYDARTKGRACLWNHSVVEPLCFTITMTLIGTQSVLHAKCLSMLMQLCIHGDNQFVTDNYPVVWVELALWIAFAVMYVNRINKGLSLYPPVFFIPVQAVAFAFFTIVCGGIFFNEFEHFTVLQTTCFAIGVVFIFAGVCSMTPSDSTIRSEHGCFEDIENACSYGNQNMSLSDKDCGGEDDPVAGGVMESDIMDQSALLAAGAKKSPSTRIKHGHGSMVVSSVEDDEVSATTGASSLNTIACIRSSGVDMTQRGSLTSVATAATATSTDLAFVEERNVILDSKNGIAMRPLEANVELKNFAIPSPSSILNPRTAQVGGAVVPDIGSTENWQPGSNGADSNEKESKVFFPDSSDGSIGKHSPGADHAFKSILDIPVPSLDVMQERRSSSDNSMSLQSEMLTPLVGENLSALFSIGSKSPKKNSEEDLFRSTDNLLAHSDHFIEVNNSPSPRIDLLKEEN